MPTAEVDEVRRAVRQTIESGSGTGTQFIRTADGSVAALVEVRWDWGRRAARMRQRFGIGPDGSDEGDPEVTDWVVSLVQDRWLYLPSPDGDDGWSAIESAGFWGSPLGVLAWLEHAERAERGPSDSLIAWARPGDGPSREGWQEAGLAASAEIPVEVRLRTGGSIAALSYEIATDDADPVRVDLELDDLGRPQPIELPVDVTPTDAGTYARDVVGD